jgi:chromosome segregation ATPase
MKTLVKNAEATKADAAPKAAKPASPAAGRRNFRLSGLEILIVVLIVLGVAYLVSMWAGAALSPEPEAAAPAAAPGTLMEKALAASEKAQAQLASLNRDIGALRKDMDNLQGRRATAPAAPGQQHAPATSGLERRLDEVEKQLQGVASHKDDKALAAATQELKTLAGRLDRLEKEMAARAQQEKRLAAAAAAPVAAAAAPVADPQLQARLDRLEQALAQTRREAAPSAAGQSEIEGRLLKLEQGLRQLGREIGRAHV